MNIKSISKELKSSKGFSIFELFVALGLSAIIITAFIQLFIYSETTPIIYSETTPIYTKTLPDGIRITANSNSEMIVTDTTGYQYWFETKKISSSDGPTIDSVAEICVQMKDSSLAWINKKLPKKFELTKITPPNPLD